MPAQSRLLYRNFNCLIHLCVFRFFQIELLGFIRHTKTVMEPLNAYIFTRLKEKIKKMAQKKEAALATFPTLLLKAQQEVLTQKHVLQSFCNCGLVPFDPTVIDSSKITTPQHLKPPK